MDDTQEISTTGTRGPVDEAPVRVLESGARMVTGPGWFVTNLEDATWWGHDQVATAYFESPEHEMPQYGVNLRVMQPGARNCLYHREFHADESFLVLAGTCVLIVEGQERDLRAGDFVHCPAGTAHVFTNTGDVPCAMVAVGARGHLPEGEPELVYEPDEAAARHGACVTTQTCDPEVAYADDPDTGLVPPAWLPPA